MDNQVSEYISKQHSPQKEICQRLRNIIFNSISNVKEEMKWGVPTYTHGKFYIAALKNHVNFGYNDGSEEMKHVEIKSLSEIDNEDMINIINLVNKTHGKR